MTKNVTSSKSKKIPLLKAAMTRLLMEKPATFRPKENDEVRLRLSLGAVLVAVGYTDLRFNYIQI